MQAILPLGWTHYLAGGVAIGLAVALLFVLTGRIGGMSTVFSSSWSWLSRRSYFQQARFVGTRAWRAVFALGLVLGAGLWWWLQGPDRPVRTGLPPGVLLAGGLLAGDGARLSGGCTSGHGICGLGSAQMPSLAAVLVFMATGFATALAVQALGWLP